MIEVLRKGTASSEDVALVAAALGGIPVAIERLAVEHGVRVAACRTSVVDIDPSLYNVIPDGWPTQPAPGRPVKYWQDVPGAYLTGPDLVAIATIGHGGSGAVHVPYTGEGHGSADLALHEFLHSFDHHAGQASATKRFNQAWTADHDAIRPEYNQDYFLNQRWGRRETFAESGARRFARQSALPRWPNTTAYWEAIANGAPLAAEDRVTPLALVADSSPGTAVLRASGDVEIFWNAVSDGAEGHYYERLERGSAANESFGQPLFSHVATTALAQPAGDRTVRLKPFSREDR